ncbi:MAG: hypothetical protein DWQ19_10295 [Crenarchaeota archaeon]|nr:MAG: hypothetical protein DWQ19_10295 [Thermoproteota archaeon]
MALFPSRGRLHYEGRKLVVEVDQQIVNFYRALVPKYVRLNPQKYAAHISVVRKEDFDPANWGRHEGEIVDFVYENKIHHGQVYYWLNAFSNRLEEIRVELELPINSEYIRPPDSYEKVFHITLGNVKNL